MNTQETRFIARATAAGTTGTSELAPGIHRQSCSRLAWIAIIYVAVYAVVYGVGFFTRSVTAQVIEDAGMHHLISWASMLMGVAVAVLAWRERLPSRHFGSVVVLFEIAAGFGIAANEWAWEVYFTGFMAAAGAVFGVDAVEFVTRLDAEGINLVRTMAVPWVGVWLLMIPMMLPVSFRKTVVGSLVTAATVPAVILASITVHGTPDTVRPWLGTYMVDISVPMFLCAAIAIAGSRITFRLTRDLSRAHEMGSYQLREKIGEGGMGEVWRADHRMLARPAAIKLIRPEVLGSDALTAQTAVLRFQREAQAIANLGSPHTVELYDFGVTGDGVFYFVMELLDGIDLRTLIERHGPLPAPRVVHLMGQVCHSLAEAHRQGIIHRDVKPGNIFTCRRGGDFDVAKVLDFGLVKESAEPHPGDAQLTQDDVTTGTPAFMAPEMAVHRDRVDARTDLYALGCVGFWLLTGRLVFEGETALAIIMSHVNDTPPAPSTMAELPVPGELDALILRCLAKDPGERPAGAAELARELAALPGDAWSPDHARGWWDTHHPSPAPGVPNPTNPG